VSLRVVWLPGPERQLLDGIRRLPTIILICETVERFAVSFEGPVERVAGHPRAVRLRAAGRIVIMDVDATSQTLTVTRLYFDDSKPLPDSR
jgi:hypothetical protein